MVIKSSIKHDDDKIDIPSIETFEYNCDIGSNTRPFINTNYIAYPINLNALPFINTNCIDYDKENILVEKIFLCGKVTIFQHDGVSMNNVITLSDEDSFEVIPKNESITSVTTCPNYGMQIQEVSFKDDYFSNIQTICIGKNSFRNCTNIEFSSILFLSVFIIDLPNLCELIIATLSFYQQTNNTIRTIILKSKYL